MVYHYDMGFSLTADFSLSEWKANRSLVSLSDGDRYLLQEELRVSRYLWAHTCSRESDDYIPHTNYWKDGNFSLSLSK